MPVRFVVAMISVAILSLVTLPPLSSPCIAVGAVAARQAPSVDDDQRKFLTFEVIVKDKAGNPLEGAFVKPGTLLTGSGNYGWINKEAGDGLKGEALRTDSDGRAIIGYPQFAFGEKKSRVRGAAVSVNHPDHCYLRGVIIDLPLEEPFEIRLRPGAAIEVAATIDGERIVSEKIHAMWTGGSFWSSDVTFTITPDRTYRIPPFEKGSVEFRLVRLEGTTATHFSKIDEVAIDVSSGTIKREHELLPAVKVTGKLSDNVPRPVKDGRLKIGTIGDIDFPAPRLRWSTWAEVKEDGTFSIESWPQDTPLQLTALCRGFVARSGEKPPMFAEKRDRKDLLRPQVFLKPSDSEITVEMKAMQPCRFQVKSTLGKKLAGISVRANIAANWWNGGTARTYAWPLLKGEDSLLNKKYIPGYGEDILPNLFESTTDENGFVELALPEGTHEFWVGKKRWQLPSVFSRQGMIVEVESGKFPKPEIVVQPIGLSELGDWQDLCGFAFGVLSETYSAMAGEHEEIQNVIDSLRERFGDNEDAARDPEILIQAYEELAQACRNVGETKEAKKYDQRVEMLRKRRL